MLSFDKNYIYATYVTNNPIMIYNMYVKIYNQTSIYYLLNQQMMLSNYTIYIYIYILYIYMLLLLLLLLLCIKNYFSKYFLEKADREQE